MASLFWLSFRCLKLVLLLFEVLFVDFANFFFKDIEAELEMNFIKKPTLSN